MFSFLKNHPFAVEAFFESSIVLTFAFPKDELEHLIPEFLRLDTFVDKFAFIAIAIVKTKGLRPKGFPEILGNNFMLIGYRIFVKYTDKRGKNLRGLYILKSETDKYKMEFLGNIFTHYNYSTTDINIVGDNDHLQIYSVKSGLNIKLTKGNENISLPLGSPFFSWKEARKFAGPLPFTFTYIKEKNDVLIIEGVREHWVPQPVSVIDYQIPFFKSVHLANPQLANAFIVSGIPYNWKKGKIEQWS